MDRIIAIFVRLRRFFMILNGLKKPCLAITTLVFVVFTKTRLYSLEWWLNSYKIYKLVPYKLLKYPAVNTFIFYIAICKVPLFPDDCIIDVLIMGYIQITNVIVIALSLSFHCGQFPFYCYHEVKPKKRDPSVEAMFLIFQILISIDMALITWYIISIRKLIVVGVKKTAKLIKENFHSLMSSIYYAMLVADMGQQRIVIIFIAIYIIGKMVFEWFFIMSPLLDIAIFFENYDNDLNEQINEETEEEDSNPQPHNQH